MGKTLINILSAIAVIYSMIAIVMILYYSWEYQNSHSFVNSMILGSIIPVLKGMFWIFFIW